MCILIFLNDPRWKKLQGNWKEKNRIEIRAKIEQKTELCEISQPLRNQHYAAKPFRNTLEFSARIFRNCEGDFGTRVPLRSTVTSISQLRNSLRSCCENGILLRNWCFVAKLKLTLGLPFFLFIPVIWATKRVSKIRAPFSQPLRLLRQATPSVSPVVFSA